MRDGQHAEILVLQADAAAGSRHPHHLGDDGGGVGHVQDDGDREGDVEAIGRKRQRDAARLAQAEASRPGGGLTETTGGGEHGTTGIDAHDLTAPADHRRHVAHHDTGAAADLEDAVAASHRHEAQEAPAEPGLGRGRAPRLQAGDHRLGVGLRVDDAPGIPVGRDHVAQPLKRPAHSVLQK
jgi:hypothetical protein